MMRWKRFLSVLLAAGLIGGVMVTNVWADSAISSVSLTVNEDLIEPGEKLSHTDADEVVSNTNSRYSIADCEWETSENREVKIGDKLKVKVVLEASSDYYFKGSYRESNVTIHNGDFVSASRKNEDTLVVTLTMDAVKGTFDEPDDAYWRDSGFGNAKWTAGDTSSDYYDVYLYRQSSLVTKMEGLHATSYDFYPYMTKEGTYTFKVRTVPNTSGDKTYGKKSDWTESDEVYIAKEDISDGTGQAGVNNTTSVGWILNGGIWYYKYPDGSFQKDSWAKVNDKWYLFDAQGRMLTGWQLRSNVWYFLNSSGDMQKGWQLDNNKWYYLNPDPQRGVEGAMMTGWINFNNKWYYANSSGALISGWNQVDGNWYYFSTSDYTKAVDTTVDGFYVDINGIWKR